MQVKKWFSRILGVIGLLIFAVGIFVFATVLFTKGHNAPNFFGFSFLNVSTGSMAPAYPVGTVVIVKKADPGSLKNGDVISFYSTDPAIEGIPNTHRIVSVQKDKNGKTYFTTKGDNNPEADKYPVYPEKVIGKVLASIGFAGKIINILKNKFVFFFLLIVPLCAIMVYEFRNLTRMIKNKDGE